MSPKAFQYYLPAFMIASLTDIEVQDHVFSVLSPPLDPGDARGMQLFLDQISLLTAAQRRAVGVFWEHFRERPEELPPEELENALVYWATYLREH